VQAFSQIQRVHAEKSVHAQAVKHTQNCQQYRFLFKRVGAPAGVLPSFGCPMRLREPGTDEEQDQGERNEPNSPNAIIGARQVLYDNRNALAKIGA